MQVKVACLSCAAGKRSCNGRQPCERCAKLGRPCVYLDITTRRQVIKETAGATSVTAAAALISHAVGVTDAIIGGGAGAVVGAALLGTGSKPMTVAVAGTGGSILASPAARFGALGSALAPMPPNATWDDLVPLGEPRPIIRLQRRFHGGDGPGQAMLAPADVGLRPASCALPQQVRLGLGTHHPLPVQG
jgi:hypothetical protein